MAENIMKLFSRLASANDEINLLNTYKGVPLIFNTHIVNVGFSSIRVSADTCQTVSMCLERRTFIQSTKFSETFRADVESINKTDMVTTLGNFSFVNFGIGNRSEIRVQPAENIPVRMQDQSGAHSLNGLITDVSQDGIGLFIGWRSFIPQLFAPGAMMILTYQLPGVFSVSQTKTFSSPGTGALDRFSTNQTRFSPTTTRDYHNTVTKEVQIGPQVLNPVMQVPAEVANVIQDNVFNRYRIGLKVLNNKIQQQYVMKYLSQRQSEIIQEIRERYAMMRKESAGLYQVDSNI